jgi:hypothetical protein
MGENLDFVCEQHSNPYDCPDYLLDIWDDGTLGLIVHDGRYALLPISNCPWCGTATGTEPIETDPSRPKIVLRRDDEPPLTISDVLPAADYSSTADGLDACDALRSALRDPALPLGYSPRFREVGITWADLGSKVTIGFCPFCGDELVSSLRDRWFDELDRLELEPDDPAVPAAMKSDAWWRASPHS